MNPYTVDAAFPFDEYREHQRDILQTSADALFDENSTDTVVIDAPTGIGKSGINMALGQLADNAFYTTPQKELREQLSADRTFDGKHHPLRGRRDYKCDQESTEYREYSCKTCPVNESDDRSCYEQGSHGCTYWRNKEAAMGHHVATITFAYLIIDNYLPLYPDTEPDPEEDAQSSLTDFNVDDNTDHNSDQGDRRVSFADRDLLIIDEAHTLEEQIASLHAGFNLSVKNISVKELSDFDSVEDGDVVSMDDSTDPYELFSDGIKQLLERPTISVDDITVDMLEGILSDLRIALKKKANNLKLVHPTKEKDREELSDIISDLESVARSIEIIFTDRKEGTPWAIDVTSYETDEETRYAAQLKPVYVDTFLERFVWSRADKIVLSTATMPYRSDPDQWLERIGLDPESSKIISRPMPFPADNRKIDTTTTVNSFSSGGWSEHLDSTCDRVEQIYQKHSPEKGLIHTVSYDRAEDLHDAFSDRALLDDSDRDMGDVIDEWQDSDDLHMLLSPRMMEGVDLEGDMCRWQVLAKTPYKPAGDPRVEYLLDEMNDWRWYKETAARRVIQAAGRAVRSKQDHARYYVLDAAIQNVLTSSTMPDWFAEAMV